jgi:hypothetical protein
MPAAAPPPRAPPVAARLGLIAALAVGCGEPAPCDRVGAPAVRSGLPDRAPTPAWDGMLGIVTGGQPSALARIRGRWAAQRFVQHYRGGSAGLVDALWLASDLRLTDSGLPMSGARLPRALVVNVETAGKAASARHIHAALHAQLALRMLQCAPFPAARWAATAPEPPVYGQVVPPPPQDTGRTSTSPLDAALARRTGVLHPVGLASPEADVARYIYVWHRYPKRLSRLAAEVPAVQARVDLLHTWYVTMGEQLPILPDPARR